MAVKVPSLNIRRLYTDEELDKANKIRDCQKNIDDIMTLKKLKELKDVGKVQKNDITNLSWEELQNYYMEEHVTKDGEIIQIKNKNKINSIHRFIRNNKKRINKDAINNFSRNDDELKEFRKCITVTKKELAELIKTNSTRRTLHTVYESDYVTLSDSYLTECLSIERNTYSHKILIIVSDQQKMMQDIISNNILFEGKTYILYGASAGQLRKKKLMFVEANVLNSAMDRLTNGLSIDKINNTIVGTDEDGNNLYGVNINKWSAYITLPTSSTTFWEDVDIDRVCVVDDFETILPNREVDHIDREYNMERIKMDVSIPHTDGFGMMCPKFCKDTRMIRAPWIKGLIAPVDFKSFVKTFNGKEIIQDIYGKDYNVFDLDIILTKSQFKMWKYYSSWDEYKENFKKFNCQFRYMIQESKKDLRLNALFNYQMWQTLDIQNPKEYAEKILSADMDILVKAHSEVGAMLNVLGVDKKYNRNKNILKAVYLYPSIIKSNGFKETLKDNIKARKNELAEGRIKINGVYTFILPDTYAWCEHLFLDIENPEGILQDGEVSCKLVDKDKDILVNRSPHLYRMEHCVRTNIKNKEHIRWFLSKGVYTSTHDMISKQLFFDVDGDIGLVVDNEELVNIAKKSVEGLVPLDFELGKAKPSKITNENIFNSYTDAFEANIGQDSNRITKVMNSNNKDLELVAKICWINNMSIDMAKTNFMVEPIGDSKVKIDELDSEKLPYFFHWVKEKDLDSVSPPNHDSLVDNMALTVFGDLTQNAKRYRFDFSSIPDFDLTIMMSNVNVCDNEELIFEFRRLADSKYRTIIKRKNEDDANFSDGHIDDFIRNEMYDYCLYNNVDIDDAVDICIKYVFGDKGKNDRNVLFSIFGDIIIDRLEQRFPEIVDGSYTRCDICGKMIMNSNRKVMYCDKCAKKIDREKAKGRMREKRC